MSRFVIIAVSLLLAAGTALAQEKKSETKKSDKAKANAQGQGKSDKNVFQKAESSIGDWAHRNKVWIRSDKK